MQTRKKRYSLPSALKQRQRSAGAANKRSRPIQPSTVVMPEPGPSTSSDVTRSTHEERTQASVETIPPHVQQLVATLNATLQACGLTVAESTSPVAAANTSDGTVTQQASAAGPQVNEGASTSRQSDSDSNIIRQRMKVMAQRETGILMVMSWTA